MENSKIINKFAIYLWLVIIALTAYYNCRLLTAIEMIILWFCYVIRDKEVKVMEDLYKQERIRRKKNN